MNEKMRYIVGFLIVCCGLVAIVDLPLIGLLLLGLGDLLMLSCDPEAVLGELRRKLE